MSKRHYDYSFPKGDGIFFSSDTHWWHKNVMEFCHRPFCSVEEMNEKLIENWNSVIGKDDIVFHLGDFCFGDNEKWKSVLEQLNGNIYLAKGNHDDDMPAGVKEYFKDIQYQYRIKVENQTIILNHYPFLCYAGSYKEIQNNPTWNLYGHVHSGPLSIGRDKSRLSVCFPEQYDVGVDNNNYFPISFNQVMEKIKQRQEDAKNKEKV